jgi:hypothetical protein
MSDIAYFDPPVTEEKQPEPDAGSLPKRILDTSLAPIALFNRFGTRPPWLGVLLIATVSTAVLAMLIPRELMEAGVREGLARNPPPAGTPAPSMETMVMIGRVITSVSQLIFQPLLALLTAGICTLVFGMLMGGGGSFRRHLAVASHASLIAPLGFVVTLFFMIQSGDATTQLSLALLAPGLETDSFAYRVLNPLNVFTLWQLALVGVGAAAVNRRVSNLKGVSVVMGIFLLFVVAIAAVRG